MQGSYRVVSKTSVAGIGGLVKQLELEALRGSGEGLADWDFPVPPNTQKPTAWNLTTTTTTKPKALP